jgi:type I site-specific restriction-modification system R (restriction) subunit
VEELYAKRERCWAAIIQQLSKRKTWSEKREMIEDMYRKKREDKTSTTQALVDKVLEKNSGYYDKEVKRRMLLSWYNEFLKEHHSKGFYEDMRGQTGVRRPSWRNMSSG